MWSLSAYDGMSEALNKAESPMLNTVSSLHSRGIGMLDQCGHCHGVVFFTERQGKSKLEAAEGLWWHLSARC